MAKSEYDTIFKDLMKRLKSMARRRFQEVYDHAKADLKEFEQEKKAKMVQLLEDLHKGDLSKSEFEELMGNHVRLAQMTAITNAGIALVEIDKFRQAATDLISRVVFDKLLKI